MHPHPLPIPPPTLPLGPLLVESVAMAAARELSGSLHPSLSLNYGCAAEIANQPLRSAGEEEEIV